MAAKIIDGKAIAARLREHIRSTIRYNTKKGSPTPTLAVIIVGQDPASMIYVRNKHKACEEVGIRSIDYSLPVNVSQKKLLVLIENKYSKLLEESKEDIPEHAESENGNGGENGEEE